MPLLETMRTIQTTSENAAVKRVAKEIYGYSATYETYKPFFVYQYRDNAKTEWHDRDRDYTGNWYKLHSFSNAENLYKGIPLASQTSLSLSFSSTMY